MLQNKYHNIAFIDGQNLYRGIDWDIDYTQFRQYLLRKYNIQKAYYFVGFRGNEKKLYENLQEAGFILIFNEKSDGLKSNKKGNIDVTLVFYVMQQFIDRTFDAALIVSGDGDFKILVDFLIDKEKFLKILAPNSRYCSSLYNKPAHLHQKFLAYLNPLKTILEYKKKKDLPVR